MGVWLDQLQDWAHDAGAGLCWGTVKVASGGKLRDNHWCNLQMPDRVIEHRALTRDSAAWAILAEVEPDPMDQPEAA